MKKMLMLGVAFGALALNTPAHAELKFKPGEDSRFHWANFDDLKKVDLKGETLTIFGPWRGEDETLVRSVLDYFSEATGAEVGSVYMPAPQTGSPMTYMLNGQQYLVIATSGATSAGELLAFKLPSESISPR